MQSYKRLYPVNQRFVCFSAIAALWVSKRNISGEKGHIKCIENLWIYEGVIITLYRRFLGSEKMRPKCQLFRVRYYSVVYALLKAGKKRREGGACWRALLQRCLCVSEGGK